MKPNLARAAWIGLVLILGGWLVAVAGFGSVDETRPLVPDSIRVGVRVFGFVLSLTGATMTMFATIGMPTLVMIAGMALNLAHQAGLIAATASGVVGAGLMLLGALWAQRKIRELPA